MMIPCGLKHVGIRSVIYKYIRKNFFFGGGGVAECCELFTDSARNEQCSGEVRVRCNQLFL
jgi:hypothetical protein